MKKDDLEIPTFLKRTETEAQAEARRKKNAPKDHSAGLKVVELPDVKITAAIAKDFVDRGRKAQAAADKVIADAAERKRKDAWKAMKADKKVGKHEALLDKPMTVQRSPKSELAATAKKMVNDAKRAAPKKAGKLVEKALQDRDALNAKATASKSAKPATNAKKPAAKSASKSLTQVAREALMTKTGATREELMKLTGWKAINIKKLVPPDKKLKNTDGRFQIV